MKNEEFCLQLKHLSSSRSFDFGISGESQWFEDEREVRSVEVTDSGVQLWLMWQHIPAVSALSLMCLGR